MSTVTTEKPAAAESFWLARSTRTIFFFAAVLTLAGIYFAFQVPISVFPETNFPRVVIGVDNGVMPVEQMEVTITRPIENAVNSVPGLETVRSITSRGSAEVSLFFDWNQDMVRQLALVDAALGKVRQTLPSTAVITTNRLTFATFPILGYSLTSDTVPQTRLWEIATYELRPPLNRVAGVSTVLVQGGQVPEFHVTPNMALLAQDGVTVTDLVNAIQASNIVDSPGLYEANHQLILGLVGAQVHDADQLRQLVVKTTAAGAPVRVADLHHGDGEREECRSDEHLAAAVEQYRYSGGRRGRGGRRAQKSSAGGRETGAVLRSVATGAGLDCQRKGCDSHWVDSGVHHSVFVFTRLVVVADCGAGDSGDGGSDDPGAACSGAELQPDDAGRAGGGDRPRDRRCDCGGREHRDASR
jgi:AcrB/AcrD/AcrF family